MFKRRSGQLNALDRNREAVNCCRVQQDSSNEREINCKSCRPGTLCGSFPSELDQPLARYVFKFHTPK